jgi:hypothetical protein
VWFRHTWIHADSSLPLEMLYAEKTVDSHPRPSSAGPDDARYLSASLATMGKATGLVCRFLGLLAVVGSLLPIAASGVAEGPGGVGVTETKRVGIALAALASGADLSGPLGA